MTPIDHPTGQPRARGAFDVLCTRWKRTETERDRTETEKKALTFGHLRRHRLRVDAATQQQFSTCDMSRQTLPEATQMMIITILITSFIPPPVRCCGCLWVSLPKAN